MRITLVAVGRVREAHVRALCDEYAKRITRYGSFDVVEVKDARGENPARAVQIEGGRILAKLPSECLAVALDEHGQGRTSRQLARWMENIRQGPTKDLRLVVGGAWGLSADVKARCAQALRLSTMTLPHELARLVLLEQLYRAHTILRREPYHHD